MQTFSNFVIILTQRYAYSWR